MITCCGAEAKSSSYKLPADAETYAKEHNLKDTFNISDRLGYDNGEMTDMLYVFDDFCSKTYPTTQIYSAYNGIGTIYHYIKLSDIKSPVDFMFKSFAVGADLPDFVFAFVNYDNHEVFIRQGLTATYAPPAPYLTYDIYYDPIRYEDMSRDYVATLFSVFNYLHDKSEKYLKSNQPPAIILCHAKYNLHPIESEKQKIV